MTTTTTSTSSVCLSSARTARRRGQSSMARRWRPFCAGGPSWWTLVPQRPRCVLRLWGTRVPQRPRWAGRSWATSVPQRRLSPGPVTGRRRDAQTRRSLGNTSPCRQRHHQKMNFAGYNLPHAGSWNHAGLSVSAYRDPIPPTVVYLTNS